ncbi:MAG: glycine--tRNA ligase [Candidatus Ancaeobacter aquaticus]|nr:glycine--tRNA ligase [Candidatus Ancaeobacter aquaticus]
MTKTKENKSPEIMDKLVSLCKRRGYIFQSSEIYGGLNSCWDYGPLGVELKRNIADIWWRSMTLKRDDVEGIDASILMHPRVWEASGHVQNFTDPLVDCKECKQRFRADQIEDVCPQCGGELTEPRLFNLMFHTFIGPVQDEANIVYLRPETAQGIYVNFMNVQTACRRKIPFGIAQIGKAFRNEITPGNFVFRTREFEQMEMQYFVKPGSDDEWLKTWKDIRINWFKELGVNPEKLRLKQHHEKELAHYAKDAYDVEYEFPFGWQELEGIHNRTDFDLKRHTEYSGKPINYFDEEAKERYVPYIIETSVGLNRTLLTCLVDAYREEEGRVVLSLSPKIAPIKAAIMPLVKRDGMDTIAYDLYNKMRNTFKVFYDVSGSIGRRYRRQDEAGTPFCVTVDSQTLEDNTVTIRERDSMKQERYAIGDVIGIIEKAVSI